MYMFNGESMESVHVHAVQHTYRYIFLGLLAENEAGMSATQLYKYKVIVLSPPINVWFQTFSLKCTCKSGNFVVEKDYKINNNIPHVL